MIIVRTPRGGTPVTPDTFASTAALVALKASVWSGMFAIRVANVSPLPAKHFSDRRVRDASFTPPT